MIIREKKWITIAFLTLLILASLTEQVGAAPHDDAKDTADKISRAINSQTLPYTREITTQNLRQLGFDTDKKRRSGDYSITIKNASYNPNTGHLTVYINATYEGEPLRIRNPVHWYIPIALSGSTNPQRLNEFLVYLISYLESREFGQPTNDDTLVVYTTGAGSGDVYRQTDGTWANIRGSDGEYGHIASTRAALQLIATTTENQWSELYRVGFSFNTSGLGSGSTIDSAVLDFPGYGKTNSLTTAQNIALTEYSPATDGVLVAGDYDTFTDTRLSSDLTYANFDIMDRYDYNKLTLNAAGLSAISKTGWTTLMLRLSGDVDNSVTWESGASTYYNIHITTTGKVPKLTIEYTPGGGSAPVAAFSANTTTGYPPFDIAFTDSSTNTPTAWEWLFGDGDTASTQSPVHTYNSWIGNAIAKYTVNLTASNAFGSDAENKTDYITAFPLNTSFSVNVTSGCAPVHIGFNSTGTGNGTATAWEWNFGGDGTSSDQNPTHIFTTPGTYWISLNASNNYSWDIENKTNLITVSSDTIASDFSADDTIVVTGQTITFNDLSTGGPIDWEWSWGDLTSNGTTQNPTHSYAAPGDYTVILTVTNECGGNDVKEKVSYINVSAPTPTPTSGPVYTGTIPNKPIVTGTWTSSPTENVNNWTWPQTGDLLKDIARNLLPEMGSSIGSFLVIAIIIICAGGFLVIFVEGWIRIMR